MNREVMRVLLLQTVSPQASVTACAQIISYAGPLFNIQKGEINMYKRQKDRCLLLSANCFAIAACIPSSDLLARIIKIAGMLVGMGFILVGLGSSEE